MTQRRDIALWTLLTLVLLGLLGWRLPQVEFRADLQQLLPTDELGSDPLQAVANDYQNRLLLLVSHKDQQQARQHTLTLQARLANLDGIQQVDTNPMGQLRLTDLIKTFKQYPLSLLSSQAEQARQQDDYGYLIERYFYLLSQPGNPLVGLTIEAAPLLNLADWLAEHQQSDWLRDGELLYLEHQEQRYYGLFIELTQEALDIQRAPVLVEHIEQAIADLAPGTEVLKSGLVLHTAAATRQAEYEMQLFGGISALGVLILTWLSFRQLRPLLTVSLLVAGSVLAGFTALVIAFRQVHLLALVFSVSLIGVAVDYGFHMLCGARQNGLTGRRLAKLMAPALLVSALTTALSYLLLTLLPVELLKQVGVFVSAGLLYALFTSLTLVVNLPPKVTKEQDGDGALVREKPLFQWWLAAMLAVLVLNSTHWRFEDDIRLFNSSPATLLASEGRVAALTGNLQYPRLLSFSATSEQQLWQRFSQIRQAFTQAGLSTTSLKGLDEWIPSLERQRQNALWLRSGIESGELTPVMQHVDEPTLSRLLDVPLAGLNLAQLPMEIRRAYPPVLDQGQELLGVMTYKGQLDAVQLESINAGLPFTLDLDDRPARISAAMKTLRHYLLGFLVLSAISILLLMSLRYGLKKGALVSAIPFLVAASSLVLSQWIGGYLSLFNLLSCVLILALLVDYLVFMAEHGRPAHVRTAILLSSATSALAFGMMVFSVTPAIYQFGLTLLLGIGLGWLTCRLMPLSWIKEPL